MDDIEPEELRQEVETRHRCGAALIRSVPISEDFQGKIAWNGVVHVFKLTGHPKATRAYAWRSTDGNLVAMLDLSPIVSPEDAVRSAIVEKLRGR